MSSLDTLKRAIVVGVAGTLAMTFYTFVAGYTHLPHADMRGMLSGFFHLNDAGAWMAYMVFGVGMAYAYRSFFRDRMPARSWMRGVFYAFFAWLFVQVIAMPVMGHGFFSGSMMTAVGMFLSMMCYGAMVGFLYEQS
ncbi:MAG: hypothetical protein ACD_73C00584G0002 [uncultured bacterium]|nr:MAG: hypothetical protein ACD_73C00584G0002 [uncultured bacterium]